MTFMRALIFDLDGTLIDTVYAHVFAWQRAFAESGLAIHGWRIHRRIGMSGGLAARAAARELGREINAAQEEVLLKRHGELFRQFLPERRPLPGADYRTARRASGQTPRSREAAGFHRRPRGSVATSIASGAPVMAPCNPQQPSDAYKIHGPR